MSEKINEMNICKFVTTHNLLYNNEIKIKKEKRNKNEDFLDPKSYFRKNCKKPLENQIVK